MLQGPKGANHRCDCDGYRPDTLSRRFERRADRLNKLLFIDPYVESVRHEYIESNAGNAGVVWIHCSDLATDPDTRSHKAVGQSAVREALG